METESARTEGRDEGLEQGREQSRVQVIQLLQLLQTLLHEEPSSTADLKEASMDELDQLVAELQERVRSRNPPS